MIVFRSRTVWRSRFAGLIRVSCGTQSTALSTLRPKRIEQTVYKSRGWLKSRLSKRAVFFELQTILPRKSTISNATRIYYLRILNLFFFFEKRNATKMIFLLFTLFDLESITPLYLLNFLFFYIDVLQMNDNLPIIFQYPRDSSPQIFRVLLFTHNMHIVLSKLCGRQRHKRGFLFIFFNDESKYDSVVIFGVEIIRVARL